MYISASAPDAPPFSDTTIGCFIRLFFWIAACIIRAIWSEAPPAPAATTISTGLVGSHAMAGAFVSAHATKAPPAAIPRPVLCIASSLLLPASVDPWRVLQNETLLGLGILDCGICNLNVLVRLFSEEPGFCDRRSDADRLQISRGIRLRAL